MINDMIRQNTIAFSFPTIAKSEDTGAGAAVNSSTGSELKFHSIFSQTLKTVNNSSKSEQHQKDTSNDVNEAEKDNSGKDGRETAQAEKTEKAAEPDSKHTRDYSRKAVKKASGEETSTKDDAVSDEKTEAADVKNSNNDSVQLTAINCLAGILGMQPEELASLLEKAGISAEELTAGNAENVAAKLSALAGLNEEQKNTLTQLLNTAAKQISANSDQTADNDAFLKLKVRLSEKEKQEGTVTETTQKASVKLTVQGSIQTGDTFETAMAKLKIKLSEKQVKASQETETVSQDSGASAEKPTGLAAEKAADSSEAALFADSDEKQEGEAAETKKEAGMTVVKADSTAVSDPSSVDNSNPAAVNVLNLNQLQKKEVASILDKAETKTTVQAKDIISQVVESAKVVTTPEKSEMVMELKPESLGKLSLKVVTEQGIVVAKFITESEQVKSILETNMQLLKDSLEKQGVNVQGFSVSVRQDNSYSAGKQYGGQNQQNGRRIVLNPVSLNRSSAGMFIQETAENLAKSNLYRFGSSTINLTA